MTSLSFFLDWNRSHSTHLFKIMSHVSVNFLWVGAEILISLYSEADSCQGKNLGNSNLAHFPTKHSEVLQKHDNYSSYGNF